MTYDNNQVWNLQTDIPTQDVAIPTSGKVEHIEVNGSTIMWSVDEPINKDQLDITVGMVYLFNPNDMTTIPLKVQILVFVCFYLNFIFRDQTRCPIHIRSVLFAVSLLQFLME